MNNRITYVSEITLILLLNFSVLLFNFIISNRTASIITVVIYIPNLIFGVLFASQMSKGVAREYLTKNMSPLLKKCFIYMVLSYLILALLMLVDGLSAQLSFLEFIAQVGTWLLTFPVAFISAFSSGLFAWTVFKSF